MKYGAGTRKTEAPMIVNGSHFAKPEVRDRRDRVEVTDISEADAENNE